MAKKLKFFSFTSKDKESFIQVLIAFAQITFGVAWGSIFLPVDQYKTLVIISNSAITALIILVIWLLNRI